MLACFLLTEEFENCADYLFVKRNVKARVESKLEDFEIEGEMGRNFVFKLQM